MFDLQYISATFLFLYLQVQAKENVIESLAVLFEKSSSTPAGASTTDSEQNSPSSSSTETAPTTDDNDRT